MPELTLKRIPFTETADKQLRTLKARTGMSANFLCRLGFCLSLEEKQMPVKLEKGFHLGREINRYTLLGEYDNLFIALLITRLTRDSLSLTKLNYYFLSHMNRGVELLHSRIQSITDLSKDFSSI